MAANTCNGNVVTTAKMGAKSIRKAAIREEKREELARMVVELQVKEGGLHASKHL